MNDDVMEELGPIDYLVVEFPKDKADFSGAMAAELKALVDGGTIRVLDMIFLKKEADGSCDAFEAHEYVDDEVGPAARVRRGDRRVAGRRRRRGDCRDTGAGDRCGHSCVGEHLGRPVRRLRSAARAVSLLPTVAFRCRRS